MIYWDFLRGRASARLMVEFGAERGLDAAAILQGSGLSRAQLDDPKGEMTASQELLVAGNLIRLLGGPGQLGLELGARYRFSTYGIWGFGVISSATLGDAIERALRLLPLTYAFTEIAFARTQEAAVLTFSADALASDLQRFMVERDLAAASLLMKEMAGPQFVPRRVTFAHERCDNRRDSGKPVTIYGVAPQYGAEASQLVFDAALLRVSLPQANPLTVAMCEDMCQQLLDRRRTKLSTCDIVRQYLMLPGGKPPDIVHLARLLNTSERTLKRRLRQEGTSYRAILAAARRELAEELIRTRQLTLTEVADRLGFSELSSFSQSFKRWSGMAPQVFAKSLGETDSSRSAAIRVAR
ncbi:MAG TPA: AraC family transcriptional regulator [Acetobacteraceae bacterium]|nr:AraC family transcriptional regulator [Acetobacteraceae bacterium]